MRNLIYSISLLLLSATLSFGQWDKSLRGLPLSWPVGFALDASSDASVVIAVGTTPELYLFTGTTWRSISTEVNITDVSMVDPKHIWFTTGFGDLFATTNSGINWTQQYYDTNKTTFMNFVQMFDLQNGIAMGDGKSTAGPVLILKTTDGGGHWISMNDSAFGGYSADMWRRISFVSQSVGYFFESGITPQKMYRTTNGGVNWTTTTFAGYAGLVKFYNASIGLAVDALDSKVHRTFDGGNSWEVFATPFDGWPNDIEFIKGDPSRVWAASASLFYSTDTGRTWSKQMTTHGNDIAFLDATHGWFLTDSGVYHTTSGPVVAVGEPAGTASMQWVLEQNYPNPFNPTTTITYETPQNARVSILLYDVLGRSTRTLVDEYKSAGRYSIEVDAGGLPSGTYFYSIRTGNYSAVKKMCLIK